MKNEQMHWEYMASSKWWRKDKQEPQDCSKIVTGASLLNMGLAPPRQFTALE